MKKVEAMLLRLFSCIQLFQSTLSDQSLEPMRRDRMVVWVFTGIAYMCVDENYKFVIFVREVWAIYEVITPH